MYSHLWVSFLTIYASSIVLAWQTSVHTIPAATDTVEGYTENFPTETVVRAASTLTRPATTITELVIPSEFLEANLNNDVLEALLDFAPDITSLPTSVLTNFASIIRNLDLSYGSGHPQPTIGSNFPDDFDRFITTASLNDELLVSIKNDLYPLEPASRTSELADLLSPYPTLSSEAMAWLAAEKPVEASSLLAEGPLVSSVLSLTAAPPTWVSVLLSELASATASATAPVSTSSSAGGVAPTGGAAVLVNAFAAVVGMAGLALL